MQYKVGDTYYCTYRGKTGGNVYRPGLVTVCDWKTRNPPSNGNCELVQFQPHKKQAEYHWIAHQYLREARSDDFEVGDIILENTLQALEAEIIEIKPRVSGVSDPPIVAEQVDENRTRCGNIFMLEPNECLLLEPIREPTLELELGPEPPNNQGRKTCYWCCTSTKKSQGFHLDVYDICPRCKK